MSAKNRLLFYALLLTLSFPIFSHEPAQPKLHQYRDKIVGTMVYVLSKGPEYFPSLFSKMPEKILLSLSILKAKIIFWQTYQNVPAYKDFVQKNSAMVPPQTFNAIPVISKSNYIKQYPLTETLTNGQFPLQGQVDTSTGTSGKPTTWIRGHQEMENVKRWIQIASKAAVGNKPYIFCNMFALGPWATGMTSTYGLTGKQLVLSIGPDIQKLFDIISEFGPNHRYVIAGYPPHMKKLVESAPLDLHEYDITIVVGGEAMSENVYESIKKAGIKEVYSSYGASDLRINIAQQTEFEHQLQAICKANPTFKKELLGTLEGTPLFFHYNPLLDYIEQTSDGKLLFTDLDKTRVSPRVRYDLGDRGSIHKVSSIMALLKKYNYTIKPRTNLPILCLYGRGEDALTFNGCNLMYDDLERALAKFPGLLDKINRYAYNKFENKNLDQQLEFWIELKQNVILSDITNDIENLNNQIIEALCQINQDFKAQIEYVRNNKDSQLPMPKTFIYEHGKSPMVQQSSHHKNKYVYDIVR